MIGRSQRMNSCSPPSSSTSSGPGREEQVERVAEDHLVAERRDVARLERLDRAAGGQRHERRRVHVAVGEMQRAGAGARVDERVRTVNTVRTLLGETYPGT